MSPFTLQKHTSGRFLCLGSFGYGFTALLRLSLQRAECDSKQKVAAEKRVQRGTTLSDQATTDEQRRAVLLLSQRKKRKQSSREEDINPCISWPDSPLPQSHLHWYKLQRKSHLDWKCKSTAPITEQPAHASLRFLFFKNGNPSALLQKKTKMY